MNLAFIGTGMLGRPMIESLLADGDAVTVWNRTEETARPLAERGATIAASPKEACLGTDTVLSCLADDDAVRAVFGDEVLEALGEGGEAAIHVSMSTISPACAEELAERHARHGVRYVAAPVLGRPDLVAKRGQGYLISGEADAKERARSILERIGKGTFDFGETAGAAHTAKLGFNFLIASAVEAMAEAFAVVEAGGLDPRHFHQMITSTLFGCPLYEGYGRQINDRGWETPLFKLSLGLKDMRLARRTAEDAGVRMRLAEVLEERLREAVEHGRGSMDWTAIAAEVREEAGLPS